MPVFSYSPGGRVQTSLIASPPIKIVTVGASTATIPATSIGFTYALCAAGGGGGNGGSICGGGGGAAGEFITGTILISELQSALALTRSQIVLAVTIGTSTSVGERGGSSTLSVGASVIAIAQGGYGGLAGTLKQGWGPAVGCTTYTGGGGTGQLAQRYDARLIAGEPNAVTTTRMNLYGDGGTGGAINSPGLLGKSGYFSIQFF